MTLSIVYLALSVFCLLFAVVYEHYSFDVFSYYMAFAFMFPLAGGAISFAALTIFTGAKSPGRLPLNLYNAGIAALTVGSIIEGVLEIYGTTNALCDVYWWVGALLLLSGVGTYIFGLTSKR